MVAFCFLTVESYQLLTVCPLEMYMILAGLQQHEIFILYCIFP